MTPFGNIERPKGVSLFRLPVGNGQPYMADISEKLVKDRQASGTQLCLILHPLFPPLHNASHRP